MNKPFKVLTVAVFPLLLSAGTALALEPGQLMRSDEQSEAQQQVIDQARASRKYMINDYSMSGVTLTTEQNSAVAKLIDPVRGSFLTADEVKSLCRSVREYLHKDVKSASRVSCYLKKDVFSIEASK